MDADLRVLPGGVSSPLGDGFEIGYVGGDGGGARLPLLDAWPVRFEYAAPAREFKSYKGMRHLPGRWWSSTMGCHVGYESWLERDHLMLLDFDPAVVAVASQPFWLFWAGENGKSVSHAPDYFARLANGCALVLDCRPLDRIKPRDEVKFDATARACEQMGWQYRLAGMPDALTTANVRWLAAYRHPRHLAGQTAAVLREVLATPAPLMAAAEVAGDPIAVLPVLFHLLWRHELVVDVSLPLHAGTMVSRREGA